MSTFRTLLSRARRIRRRVRGEALARWVRLWGGSAGRGILVDAGVTLRHPPGRGWNIGDNVYFGRGAILDVRPGARLLIGSGTKVMHHVVIGVEQEVRIGRDSQIAEFSSVRDADHSVDTPGLISAAPMVARPVSIGDNTWVGRGSAVISGGSTGGGVVVGANSVVRTHIPDDSIAVGAPARVVRQRNTQ